MHLERYAPVDLPCQFGNIFQDAANRAASNKSMFGFYLSITTGLFRGGMITRMKQSPRLMVLAGSLVLSLSACHSQATGGGISPETLRQITPQLQDGDLIFIRIGNPVFRQVAKTTRSWETHVGILFSRPDGTWQVAESRFPLSKFSSLDRFIGRSEHGRFLITRPQVELTPEEKEQLRQSARERMGKLYDLGFNYDSRLLYCSKFVFDVYREATGRQVGNLTTFRQLLADNSQAPLRFWRVWFFGFIPWERRCITTTSELKSREFVPVYDSTTLQPAHLAT